jgi:hypothetical protein
MNTPTPTSLPRRLRLNPVDYFFYCHHRLMRRRGEPGYVAFMTIELDGHIEPARLRTAIERGLLAHPVLMSSLRLSRLRGRPYWLIPEDPPRAAQTAAAEMHTHDDLRDHDDWQATLEASCQERCLPTWDVTSGPQFALMQYSLPSNRTRICLHWPHLLMDAMGAMLFLGELSRLGDGESSQCEARTEGRPPFLRRDDDTFDPLEGRSLLERLRLFRQSFSTVKAHGSLEVKGLLPDKLPPFRDQRYLHRYWEAAAFGRIRANAKRIMPPGPALYARYMAVCTIRALHRIFTEQGVESQAYLITMPTTVADVEPSSLDKAARPIIGNYLVSPTLVGRRDLIHDKRALGEDLTQQLATYHETRTPLKQWAMAWLAGTMRASVYQQVLRLPLGFEALSSGFSYYGETAQPTRTLCGATITNMWGNGPSLIPPGWNPVFSKFGDTLNASLTYARPAISDDLAARYLALIEDEALESY